MKFWSSFGFPIGNSSDAPPHGATPDPFWARKQLGSEFRIGNASELYATRLIPPTGPAKNPTWTSGVRTPPFWARAFPPIARMAKAESISRRRLRIVVCPKKEVKHLFMGLHGPAQAV